MTPHHNYVLHPYLAAEVHRRYRAARRPDRAVRPVGPARPPRLRRIRRRWSLRRWVTWRAA
jgi:hypothetical protein